MEIHPVQEHTSMLWICTSNTSAIPMQVFSSAILNKALIKDLSQPVPLHLVAAYHEAREAQQK